MDPNDGPSLGGTHEARDRRAFELLDPGIQRQLYRMGWTALRRLQIDAIETITGTDQDILIMAETASGKTEAAFLPILSLLATEASGSIRALYVGPLRALINDQFLRMEELCTFLDLPVFKWHGEVSQTVKHRCIRNPAGVLLITPESIESIFINQSAHLGRLFGGLRFVVIDELHAFLGNERGMHLASLLTRIHTFQIQGEHGFREVGLSATIGDPEPAKAFLHPDDPTQVALIQPRGEGKELHLEVHAYDRSVLENPDPGEGPKSRQEDVRITRLRPVAHDIVRHCGGGSNLVFANRKADVEVLCDLCTEFAAPQGLPQNYLVHHGSLSRDIRETAEELMKGSGQRTTFCSSTLELGIDIGSIRLVGQVGAPWTVASLKQRLGRSGRHEGEPRRLSIYVPYPVGDEPELLQRLSYDLIAAIASTELLLEGWVEPMYPPACDLSTLTQQILSVIVEKGGVRTEAIYDLLCRKGPFRGIEASLFAKLMRALGGKDILEQDPAGEIILGLEGEKIVESLDFYGVFNASKEVKVVHEGRVLGALPVLVLPKVNSFIVFAGRKWKVLSVDLGEWEIEVEPSVSRGRPKFAGYGGGVHPRLRQKMREVLSSRATYAYLDAMAGQFLSTAREVAREADLCKERFVALGANSTLAMTWTGSDIQKTLLAMLGLTDINCHDAAIGILFPGSIAEVREAFASIKGHSFSPEGLTECVERDADRKFDYLLDEDLLRVMISREIIDLDGAKRVCEQILSE